MEIMTRALRSSPSNYYDIPSFRCQSLTLEQRAKLLEMPCDSFTVSLTGLVINTIILVRL